MTRCAQRTSKLIVWAMGAMMSRTARCGALFVLLALVGSGCQNTHNIQMGHDILSPPEKTLSVHQLAQRLRLNVAEDTGPVVVLRNAANLIMIFPDPGGQAYVNGQPVGPQGGIARVRGVVFVPEALEVYIRSSLKPVPAPPRPVPLGRQYRVVVDPGHGGKDPGAIGRNGLMEKTVNLAVAAEVARLLRQDGFAVSMTRQTDIFVELDERARIADRFDADLFVSIHADSCNNPSARGYTVYTCRGASHRSDAAAKAVVEALDGNGIGNRGVRKANYRVLVQTGCPAILVELGFLSNGAEAGMLASGEVQKRLARSVAEGVRTFFAE